MVSYLPLFFLNPSEGSRAGIKAAQVICVPYGMILSNDQRESLGINLQGNIVIFDEAHNIVDAANNSHSAEISTHHLKSIAGVLHSYLNRFRSVLSGKNLYNLQVLTSVVTSLLEKIHTVARADSLDPNYLTLVLNSNDFLFRFGLDNINLLQLCKHAKEVHLAHKLSTSLMEGELTTSESPSSDSAPEPSSILNALRSLFQFLSSLCNRDSDGRVFLVAESTQFLEFHLRFALINPSTHFKQIIDQARSVLFLGGTLRPFSLISSQLFPHLLVSPSHQSSRAIVEYSCGHIIPPSHINATILTHGPSGSPLNFRYSTRNSSTILSDLLSVIKEITRVISYGVVIFFPSYSYLDFVLQHWRSSGLFRQLSSLKPIYVDSRNQSGNSSDIWRDYSVAATASPRGACLLSVVGGKLSEGINFCDDLARCVAVVGMPYPDRNDPILQEKLKHTEATNPGSGKYLYDSLCMRAVNQSIGRSIRHINDSASIVLLDIRYSQKKITDLLPNWISQMVTTTNDPCALSHSLEDFVNRSRTR
jgi:chromosome transmission fidelity protein 1